MTRQALVRASALAGLALGFLGLYLLRLFEHPEIDQSLFAYYGHWIFHGLTLYVDLWDSKPPGIFVLYGVAEHLVGARFADGLLMMLAAAASGFLSARLARRSFPAATSLCCGAFALFLWSAPPFGGALSTAQAESLMAPLLLVAALVAGRGGRGGLSAGLLLGMALCLKIVAVFLLPLAWLFASPPQRRNARHSFAVLAGFLVLPATCAIALASAHALAPALRAVFEYPQVYVAEIMSRVALLPALATAATSLARGLPMTLLLALLAGVTGMRQALVRRSLIWLLLAAIATVSQRLMSTYHLVLLVPPLALLAGFGAAKASALARHAWRGTQKLEIGAATQLLVLAAFLGTAGVVEARLWARQYAPHVARVRQRLDDREFLLRQGPAGRLWLEAEEIGASIHELARGEEEILVWGLAPAVYVHSGCKPATRYAFHQTLLVQGSALSERWPDARSRRRALLEQLQAQPPRFVVIVRGDRNGFEPRDSATELQDFPALEEFLRSGYEPQHDTRAYTLLVRMDSPAR